MYIWFRKTCRLRNLFWELFWELFFSFCTSTSCERGLRDHLTELRLSGSVMTSCCVPEVDTSPLCPSSSPSPTVFKFCKSDYTQNCRRLPIQYVSVFWDGWTLVSYSLKSRGPADFHMTLTVVWCEQLIGTINWDTNAPSSHRCVQWPEYTTWSIRHIGVSADCPDIFFKKTRSPSQ